MKQTALYQKHMNLGAKMVPFAGYQMPVQYTSVTTEHMAVRDNIGVFDVSHMGQFFISGEKSTDFLQYLTSNNVKTMANNQAQYTCLPNEVGGIVDDLIIYKIHDNKWLAVVNAANINKDWEWFTKHNHFGAELNNQSDNMSLLAIQGPNAAKAMQSLTNIDLASIPFYHFAVGTFAGVANVIISATGYTGSGGFEVYFDNQNAEPIWDNIMQAGNKFNLQACGLAARDTLRLEKGYCLYGNDINDTTSPLEAGLGWITKLNTPDDFVGKDWLIQQKQQGIQRKLVAFQLQERGIPRKDYCIVDALQNPIGVVTSGTQSPMLNCGIGLGYVGIEHSQFNTEIYIQIRNKNIAAKVVKLPFV